MIYEIVCALHFAELPAGLRICLSKNLKKKEPLSSAVEQEGLHCRRIRYLLRSWTIACSSLEGASFRPSENEQNVLTYVAGGSWIAAELRLNRTEPRQAQLRRLSGTTRECARTTCRS